jgi:hypothetical protein
MLRREQGTLSKNREAYDGNGRPAAAVDRKETAMADYCFGRCSSCSAFLLLLFFIFLFLVFLL